MSEHVWSDERISRVVRDVTSEAGVYKPWHTVVDADMVTVLLKEVRGAPPMPEHAVPVEAIQELIECVETLAAYPYPMMDHHAQLYVEDVAIVRAWLAVRSEATP